MTTPQTLPTSDPMSDPTSELTSSTTHDVAVIGGSVAGLSAALVLGRARRRVAVIDDGTPRNAPAAHLHSYLSRDNSSPGELLAIGRAEVTGYGGELIADRAVSVHGAIDGFTVELASGRTITVRRLLLATGVRDQLPDVPGIQERWGVDVVHCPYCFGYEVADQPVGVLGVGANPARKALTIRHWSADTTLFLQAAAVLSAAEQERLEANGVAVVRDEVTGLVVDDDRLTGVRLASGAVHNIAALFLTPRCFLRDEPFAALGLVTEDGALGTAVVTDPTGLTSVAGVWAAGSVTNPGAQLIHAAASGSRAAIAMNNDMIQRDADRRLATAQEQLEHA